MLRHISLVLGIGAFLTIFAQDARAQTNGTPTTSGESLESLEGRSIENDFDVFFPDNSQTVEPSNSGSFGNGNRRADAGFDLFGEDVKIDVGDNLRSTDPFFDPAIADGDEADSEKVRLLLEFEEWNTTK
jgi:hypothetical protein